LKVNSASYWFKLYRSIFTVPAKYEKDYLLQLAVNYKKTNITIMKYKTEILQKL